MNFNKLLPGDEVFISIEGIRKPAAVRVVDPFLELVTVECGNEEIIASSSKLQVDLPSIRGTHTSGH